MSVKGERDTGRGGDKKSLSRDTTLKTLPEMGVTRDQSSKWQKLADVPEDVFEVALAMAIGLYNREPPQIESVYNSGRGLLTI